MENWRYTIVTLFASVGCFVCLCPWTTMAPFRIAKGKPIDYARLCRASTTKWHSFIHDPAQYINDLAPTVDADAYLQVTETGQVTEMGHPSFQLKLEKNRCRQKEVGIFYWLQDGVVVLQCVKPIMPSDEAGKLNFARLKITEESLAWEERHKKGVGDEWHLLKG